MERLLYIAAFCLSFALLSAQEKGSEQFIDIPVVDFETLSPIFKSAGDTTVVINFWATWCKPCVEEIGYFDELLTAYNEKPLKVYLVSLDFPRQMESSLIPFVNKRNIRSKVLLLDEVNANTWVDKVHPSWSGAIPATLAHRKGEKLFLEGKFKDYNHLKGWVNQLQKEQ